MMVIAQQTIPRGGVLTVDPIGEGEHPAFASRPAGSTPACRKISPISWCGPRRGVDAHAVQPYYTRLLAQACGLNVVLAPEGDAVVVTAS